METFRGRMRVGNIIMGEMRDDYNKVRDLINSALSLIFDKKFHE